MNTNIHNKKTGCTLVRGNRLNENILKRIIRNSSNQCNKILSCSLLLLFWIQISSYWRIGDRIFYGCRWGLLLGFTWASATAWNRQHQG